MTNFRFDPCVNCCGGCPVCKDQATPRELQVDISGIVAGVDPDPGNDSYTPCGNCGMLNATLILPFSAQSLADPASGTDAHCVWMSTSLFGGSASDPGPWTCDADPWQRITSIWLFITQLAGGTYDLELWLFSDFAWPYYGPWIIYQTNVGDQAPDCMHFQGLELPYQSSYTDPSAPHALGCNPAASTCKLTTVS
jgi:hypothetical protein